MKVFYKASIVVFNLCLIIWAIILPALCMASNEDYYHAQFEKNGIYATEGENGEKESTVIYFIGGDIKSSARFTDEQLDKIIKHIVDYLFRGKKAFALQMDDVNLNGEITDGVSIFGEQAVTHMKDVKILMNVALWVGIASLLICCGLLVLFIIKRREVAEFILKYTLVFYAVLFSLIIIFLIWTLLTMNGEPFVDTLWTNVHYLLFPFQPEKIKGSFFNDTLTYILTLELFITAVVVVVSILIAALAAWFAGVYFIKRSGEKGNKHQLKRS